MAITGLSTADFTGVLRLEGPFTTGDETADQVRDRAWEFMDVLRLPDYRARQLKREWIQIDVVAPPSANSALFAAGGTAVAGSAASSAASTGCTVSRSTPCWLRASRT